MTSMKALPPKLLRMPPGHLVYAVLFLIAFLLRFPFFFRDYIDRDESTFILVGQAWVDGYLPYTLLWDVKPPLTFFFFAGVIYCFGKSLIAIRLAGTFLVASIGFSSYLLAKRFTDRRLAYAAAISIIYLCSLFGSIQGVMSEHILMAAFMSALVILTGADRLMNWMLGGTLLGISLMIKINFSMVVFLLGIWWMVDSFKRYEFPRAVGRIAALGLPGLAVILTTFYPYYRSDQTDIWWNSVILAPLGYTQGSGSSPIAAILVTLSVVSFLAWAARSKRISMRRKETICLVLTILGVLWSFLQSGRINTHYLIQLYPPLVILLSAALSLKVLHHASGKKGLVILILLLIPMESTLEYVHVARYRYERGQYYNGEGFSVPDYLRRNKLETENVLFLGYHIGYWMLDRYPPVRTATHPSNLCKDEMFPYYNAQRPTAMLELQYLMDSIRPPTVITRLNKRIFDKQHREENAYMQASLKSHYRVVDTVEQAVIYEREKIRLE